MALRPCKECKQQISTDAKVCPHCGKKVGMSTLSGCLLAVLGFFLLVGWLGSSMHQGQNGATGAPTADPKSKALSNVKLDFRWGKEGFGNVMEANFTVKNDSVTTMSKTLKSNAAISPRVEQRLTATPAPSMTL